MKRAKSFITYKYQDFVKSSNEMKSLTGGVDFEELKWLNPLHVITDNEILVPLTSYKRMVGEIAELMGEPVELVSEPVELDFDEVLKTLNIAEKLLPGNDMKIRSAIESLRGFSYLGLNNFISARDFFERALYDEPDSSDACAGLGEVFFLTGYTKESKTMFEWAVAYNPGNKFARAGLLKVNKALGVEEYHNSLVKGYN